MEKVINSFPGYEYVNGHNMYRGEDVGRGGYVYAEPGVYYDVALLDVASMHPHSGIGLNIFGDEDTKHFEDLVECRIAIKNGDIERAKTLMDGALAEILNDIPEDQYTDVAYALKIAINSVYGLTSASFPNSFKDPLNVNNIVALKGALFMVNLKHEVQDKGFTVAHIKTDSIKIPNATKEIIDFCCHYAHQYGYEFEHEATYDRMCLVNDAVYIAKYASVEHCIDIYGEDYVNMVKSILKDNKKHPEQWTATGTQFQVPFVFKTLFSKEPIEFSDMCEIKQVTTSLYLDMNENLAEGEHDYRFVGKVGKFCPVMPGLGGGFLMRKSGEDKYAFATGAKGYRWLESDTVKLLNKEDGIDISYYRSLVDAAVEAIEKYTGSIDNFIGG